jgi:NAD(P)H-dependent FMN reductase
MNKINIPIILGATRETRTSIWAAKLVEKVINENYPDIETVFVDPNDFNIPHDGDSDPKFTAITKKANAFIIVFPEYNHGYPGKLKTLLDSEYDNYKDKPVMTAGWSSGPFGGARGIENLVPVLKELGMIITQTDICFSNRDETWSKSGELKDLRYIERIKENVNELLRVVKLVSK